MPWGDRTGPFGAGPRTGRGLGYCSGNTMPGYMVGGPGLGLGRGWGRGFGRGWGRGWFGRGRGWGWGRGFWGWYDPYYPTSTVTKTDEKKFLEDQINGLSKTIETLKSRLEELEKEEQD